MGIGFAFFGLAIYASIACLQTRNEANAMDGYVSPDFRRNVITPRPTYAYELEKYRMFYYDEIGFDWGICDS
jgi:glutathionylspermidine synthase